MIKNMLLQALVGSNTGIFVGCIWLEYGDLLAQHGASGSAFAVTGNGLAFLAGRVSYTFGFAGPCVPTNTGTISTHTVLCVVLSYCTCMHDI